MKKILYFIILFILSKSYITIPFQIKLKNSLTPENLMLTLQNNIILTNITLGTPPQNLEINIKMRKTPFYISGYYCRKLNISYFNEIKSKTFNYYEPEDEYFIGEDLLSGNLGYDNFIIGIKKTELYKFDFYVASSLNFISSGVLGLGISSNDKYANCSNFIKNLKIKNLIKFNDFFFDFINPNEGNLIIGEFPHFYNSKKYILGNLRYIKVEVTKLNGQYFDIGFENITYGNKLVIKQFFIGELSIENGLIKASKIFGEFILEEFFRKYLDNQLCKINEFIIDNSKMTSFVCDENIDIKKFKNINFSINNQENTFSLSYKDVFLNFQGKYYFLIYYNNNDNKDSWELGKIFLQKFKMSFDQDNKKIGYYFEEINTTNNKNFFSLPWFIVFICFLIIILMSYVICHLMKKMKIRKRRANELEEDINYINFEKNNQ